MLHRFAPGVTCSHPRRSLTRPGIIRFQRMGTRPAAVRPLAMSSDTLPAPGHVQRLQIFFENIITNGYTGTADMPSMRVDYRRPDQAAPLLARRTVPVVIKDRIRQLMAPFGAPVVAAQQPATGQSARKRDSTPRSAVSFGDAPADPHRAVHIGNARRESDQGSRPNLIGAGSVQRSRVSSNKLSVEEAAFVPKALKTTLEKVDSMVIDDKEVLDGINQADEFDVGWDSAEDHSVSAAVDQDDIIDGEEETVSGVEDEDDAQALFHARLIVDFQGQTGSELHGKKGDRVVAYEVNDDGWCLVRNGDEIGWIPQSFIEMVDRRQARQRSTSSSLAPSFEVDFRNAIPGQADRDNVLKFVADSGLLSEARAHGNVVVYADLIDGILRAGRTTSGALSALLELERHRRNFPDLKSIADAVAHLRASWDDVAVEAAHVIASGAASLFKDPRTTLSMEGVTRIIIESTCGSAIVERLKEEIAHEPRHERASDLLSALQVRAQAHARARDTTAQEDCKTVFQALRRPDLHVFRGFLDLRPNPVLQVLYNGMTCDQVVAGLDALSAQGVLFDDLESIMCAVYKAAGHDPSRLCMGPGSPLAKYAAAEGDQDDANMTQAQRVQYQAKAIMTALSHPSITLFAAIDGNVSIRLADIAELMKAEPSLPSVLCNIHLLNARGVQLASFQDLVASQHEPSLSTAKTAVLEALRRHADELFVVEGAAAVSSMTLEGVSRFLNATGAHADALSILQDDIIGKRRQFETITALAASIAKIHEERAAARTRDIAEVSAWFGDHAVFNKPVDLFAADVAALLDRAGSAPALLSALNHFVDKGVSFATLDDLHTTADKFFQTAPKPNEQ